MVLSPATKLVGETMPQLLLIDTVPPSLDEMVNCAVVAFTAPGISVTSVTVGEALSCTTRRVSALPFPAISVRRVSATDTVISP